MCAIGASTMTKQRGDALYGAVRLMPPFEVAVKSSYLELFPKYIKIFLANLPYLFKREAKIIYADNYILNIFVLLLLKKFLERKTIVLEIGDLPEEYEELFSRDNIKKLFFNGYSKIFYAVLYNLRRNLLLILPNYRFERVIRARCPQGALLRVSKAKKGYVGEAAILALCREINVEDRKKMRMHLEQKLIEHHNFISLYAGTLSTLSFFFLLVRALKILIKTFELSTITLFIFGKGEFFRKIYQKTGKVSCLKVVYKSSMYDKREILIRVISRGKYYRKCLIDDRITIYLSPYVSEKFLEMNASFFDAGLLTFVPGIIYNYLLTTKKLLLYMKMKLPIIVPRGSYAQELLEKLQYPHITVNVYENG